MLSQSTDRICSMPVETVPLPTGRSTDTANKAFVGVASIALFVLGVAIRGAVLMVLWRWFFQPLGLNPIGLAHAVGIVITVQFATARMARKIEDKTARTKAALAYLFVTPAVVLVIGYLVHLLMG